MTDHPERRLSHWTMEFLDRVMLTDVPHHWTAVDTGTILTKQGTAEEKRAARAAWENSRRFMGIKPHHLDTYVYQYPLFAQIELKVAKTEDAAYKAVTTGQSDTMRALARQQCHYSVAWSIRSYCDALRRIGFRLHANTENIVVEYEHRYEAAQVVAEIKSGAVVRKVSKPRTKGPRYTFSKVATKRAAKSGVLI